MLTLLVSAKAKSEKKQMSFVNRVIHRGSAVCVGDVGRRTESRKLFRPVPLTDTTTDF